MFKLLAITAIVSGAIAYGAPAAAAQAMSMPEDATIAVSHTSADAIQSTAEPMQDDISPDGPLHETAPTHTSPAGIAAHASHPDSTSATGVRTDRAHPAVGTDAASANPATHKNHTSATWQSLLPGVMK